MSLVNRIREEGKKNNLTIASIERESGLSNGTIGRWDKSSPSADNLYKVSKILHCSMEYLLCGERKEIILSDNESEWLDLYKNLSSNNYIKQECIGFVKGYIERGNIEHKKNQS